MASSPSCNHKNKVDINKALVRGKKLSESLSQLHASLVEAQSLNAASSVMGDKAEESRVGSRIEMYEGVSDCAQCV